MFSKKSVKPLELVVSAIYCLGEKNGSSPQNILRFLMGKYNVDPETLKPHVQTGLKRGVNFGMITQQAGLYKLNNILSNPEFLRMEKMKKVQKAKLQKRCKPVRKRKLKQTVAKKGKRRVAKPMPSTLQKNKRKLKKVKEKKKKIGARRVQNEPRKRKQKQPKIEGKERIKGKKIKQIVEKEKKVNNEPEQTKPPGGEGQKTETAKEGEAAKTAVKT